MSIGWALIGIGDRIDWQIEMALPPARLYGYGAK